MGFPFVSMKMSKCFGIKLLQILTCYLQILFTTVLTHLRLLKQTDTTLQDESSNYVLMIVDRLSPTPVPVPVDVLTALIKKRLVVTKFSSILKRLGKNEEEEWMCVVCFDSINNGDEIRELCNCCHVFHKQCLDHWMDEGQITCPICRSMLFPDNIFTATTSSGGGHPSLDYS